ncbi:MAG: hypothetical protein GVX96_02620 [Bacteroidetes bacterium]|jgi:cell division transport system permease protein|nr:hypothetical protein [Bacteroidota bacterium]
MMKEAHPNYTLTILSVSLVLFLFGIYAFIFVHPEIIVDRLKEELQIVVELEDGVRSENRMEIENHLSNLEWVRPNSIEFVSSDDAARDMRFELGPLAEELDVSSPFSDLFMFSVYAENYEPVTLEMIKVQVEKQNGVDKVYYQTDAHENLEKALSQWSKYALYLGLAFALIAFILVYNTLKLALYSRRKTILTLDMVGARKSFIRKPFIYKSIVHGILSSGIAIVLILIGILLIGQEFEGVFSLFNSTGFLFWILGMLILGIFLQLISTRFILHRFLSGRIQ